ncbi:FkbM family methyltransferase [Lacibacter sp.]|uniref:FkbM family methyltransferase n=1 Tax=Lacibacter sp. TaxID=1915409 RepID=UPI002B4B5769|nr:FkbM family methyltransferase [Lacibacter sp.]HLP35720.1 FkbM family methyltransferase [Lacibacter sp.]
MSFFNLKEFKKIITSTFFRHLRSSYSQSGEDIIISDLFARLNIVQPSYLDIGANEPVALSNTYRLYTKGSRGVCIEPNPVLYKKLRQTRKKDVCINAGIAFNEKTEADYYVFQDDAHGLNTFSKTDADFWEQTGIEALGRFQVKEVIKTKLININEIIANYFNPYPNFISLDVEGLDLQIAQTLDFDKYKPEVFCVETLMYTSNKKEIKNLELINFFEDNGYFVYADTYINTVFCRKSAYKNLA